METRGSSAFGVGFAVKRDSAVMMKEERGEGKRGSGRALQKTG